MASKVFINPAFEAVKVLEFRRTEAVAFGKSAQLMRISITGAPGLVAAPERLLPPSKVVIAGEIGGERVSVLSWEGADPETYDSAGLMLPVPMDTMYINIDAQIIPVVVRAWVTV